MSVACLAARDKEILGLHHMAAEHRVGVPRRYPLMHGGGQEGLLLVSAAVGPCLLLLESRALLRNAAAQPIVPNCDSAGQMAAFTRLMRSNS